MPHTIRRSPKFGPKMRRALCRSAGVLSVSAGAWGVLMGHFTVWFEELIRKSIIILRQSRPRKIRLTMNEIEYVLGNDEHV